ncbi:MAG: Holliday junction resolvase RuvX [Alphaproteobacteria bacterium CG_4_10_14_0_8_um_filter_53_9]|nr:MAG: Holliday junction resolvase RuvX [Alphaproteobacteria bacterium CG_4_10_14_0_8_um_filter_53_9]
MPTRNPQTLPAGRWLALDIGTKRTGMAVSNSARTLATPKGSTDKLQNLDWDALKAEGITAVVIGFPLNMDGTEGPSTDRARSAADWVEKNTGLPTCLTDERLTSHQAEQAFSQQRTQGSRQTRASKKDSVGKIDATAATLILQATLDRLA